MTRGFMKSASVAALSLALSSTVYAADLGGNCCADLEERVAELEATVAKKGTRKVSLTVYGWVNKLIMHWDDGVQTNNYLGIDNTNSATRFGFRGDAAINSEWRAGYSILLDVFTGATSARVNQASEDGNGVVSGTCTVAGATCTFTNGQTFDDHLIRMRDANLFLESSRIGRFTLGRLTQTGPQGTIDLGGIANVASASLSLIGNNMTFRRANDGGLSGTTIGRATDDAAAFNERVDGIRWDSPTWHGFVIGASVGEAREVDRTSPASAALAPGNTAGIPAGSLGVAYAVNLRYAGEFNGVRMASAIGYEVTRNEEASGSVGLNRPDSVNWGSSTSLLHTATGLFLQGHTLIQERGNDNGTSDKTSNFLIQAGLTRNFFGIGATALYGEFARVKNGFETFTNRGPQNFADNITYKMWGLGMTQNIDAAAMQLYAGYRNHGVDGGSFTAVGGARDIGIFVAGARINF